MELSTAAVFLTALLFVYKVSLRFDNLEEKLRYHISKRKKSTKCKCVCKKKSK